MRTLDFVSLLSYYYYYFPNTCTVYKIWKTIAPINLKLQNMLGTHETANEFFGGGHSLTRFYDMPFFGKNFEHQYLRNYQSDFFQIEICCVSLQAATFFFFDLSCPGTSLKSYFHISQSHFKAWYLLNYATWPLTMY